MAGKESTRPVSRRSFVKGVAATGFVLATAHSAHAQPVRQSVTGTGFRQATLDSYKRAIGKMIGLPPTDPRNWYRQATIHILDCPHHNWWFLPWHRGYLLNFERICRELSGDPDFALPYWDWTATPQMPDAFFDDLLDPGRPPYIADVNTLQNRFRQPLASFVTSLNDDQKKSMAGRGYASVDDLMADIGGAFSPVARGLTRQNPALPDFAQQAVAIDVIHATLGLSRFQDFASEPGTFHLDGIADGQLESQPHNNVHGGVRGMMGAFMSPVDPIFWLHHANLDRLWGVWARGRGGTLGPGDPSWGPEKFVFFVDQSGNPAPTTADGATDPSGVQYQPGSGEEAVPVAAAAALAAAPAAPPPPVATFASSQGPQNLQVAREVALPVQVPANVLQDLSSRLRRAPAIPAAAALVAAQAQPATGPSHLIARLKVTPPPQARDYVLRVFMNCPYLSAGTPLTDPHYAGSIVFFGDHHHAGGQAITYSLLLNPGLARLLATGQYPGAQIRLQVLTASSNMEARTLEAKVESAQIDAI
jgi:tyrosinase